MGTPFSISIHNVDCVIYILLHISDSIFRKCVFLKINNSLMPEAILSFYKSQWENKNCQVSIDDFDWKAEHFFLRQKSQNTLNTDDFSFPDFHWRSEHSPTHDDLSLCVSCMRRESEECWDSPCLFWNGLLLWREATGFFPGYKAELCTPSLCCPGHNSLNTNLQLMQNCSQTWCKGVKQAMKCFV